MNESLKFLVYGPPKHGKTASLRNLPAEKTCLINCDRKELPSSMSIGYKTVLVENDQGKKIPDFLQSNYVKTVKLNTILEAMRIWETRDDIEFIAIDTITKFMEKQFMDRVLTKGFDKFNQIADAVYQILDQVKSSKKNYIILAHNETDYDSNGVKVDKVRQFGKLVGEKVEIPSEFSNVLVPRVRRSEGGVKYVFETQSDGTTSAGISEFVVGDKGEIISALEFEEPNDMMYIFNKLNNFKNGQ